LNYLVTIEQIFDDHTVQDIEREHYANSLFEALMWITDETATLDITEDMVSIDEMNEWVTVKKANESYRYKLHLHTELTDGSFHPFNEEHIAIEAIA